MKKINMIMYYAIGLFIILLDRYSKQWAFFSGNAYYNFFPFEIIPVINHGIAFGFFQESSTIKTVLLMVGILVSLLGVIYSAWKRYAYGERIFAETLILAGGISNIIDRFVYGGVLDFLTIEVIFYGYLPIGNIADCFIVVGVCWMLLDWIFFDLWLEMIQEKK